MAFQTECNVMNLHCACTWSVSMHWESPKVGWWNPAFWSITQPSPFQVIFFFYLHAFYITPWTQYANNQKKKKKQLCSHSGSDWIIHSRTKAQIHVLDFKKIVPHFQTVNARWYKLSRGEFLPAHAKITVGNKCLT